MAIKRGMERGEEGESVCVCVCVSVRERVSGREGDRESVWGRKKNNLFKSPPSFFFPLVSLLFSKALWSVKHSFFLLLGKMETLRLSPGCGAGKDFSFLFFFFSPGSIFSFPPSTCHHPNPVISLSLCLRFVPSGDLFFTRFLVFGAATRFDLICLVLYLQFPLNCSVPPAFKPGMETALLFVCARKSWAVGLG